MKYSVQKTRSKLGGNGRIRPEMGGGGQNPKQDLAEGLTGKSQSDPKRSDSAYKVIQSPFRFLRRLPKRNEAGVDAPSSGR